MRAHLLCGPFSRDRKPESWLPTEPPPSCLSVLPVSLSHFQLGNGVTSSRAPMPKLPSYYPNPATALKWHRHLFFDCRLPVKKELLKLKRSQAWEVPCRSRRGWTGRNSRKCHVVHSFTSPSELRAFPFL